MKKKQGFVSNSSSSSFVCNVCNTIDVIDNGNDDFYNDNNVFVCINGHNLHGSCINQEEALELKKECYITYFKQDEKCCNNNEEYKASYYKNTKICLDLLQGALGTAELVLKYDGYDITNLEDLIEYIGELESDIYYEWRHYFPEDKCPICQLDIISDSDLLIYELYEHYHLKLKDSKKALYSNIKLEFKDYKSFKKYLNEEEKRFHK